MAIQPPETRVSDRSSLPDWTSVTPDEYALLSAERALAEAPIVEVATWDPAWGPDPRDDPAYQPTTPAQAVRLARMVSEAVHEGVDTIVSESLRPDLASVATLTEPVDVDVWHVDGVLRPGGVLIVAAAEGVGKTQTARELAIRAATGTGALFGHYAIPRSLRVCVVDEENGPTEEWRRDEAILAALHLERTSLTGYFRASFVGMSLTDAASQRWLDAQVEAIVPDILILDTGTSMLDEEWGPPMKAAMRYVRSLVARFGCAIVLLVHLTKPPREHRAGAVTHGTSLADVMGQWTRVADAVALMADLGDDRVRWEMRKKVPPSTLVLVRREGVFEVVSVGEVRKPSQVDRVLRAISTGADSAEAITAGTGIARRSVFRALADLRKVGMVDEGSAIALTEAGWEAVS